MRLICHVFKNLTGEILWIIEVVPLARYTSCEIEHMFASLSQFEILN